MKRLLLALLFLGGLLAEAQSAMTINVSEVSGKATAVCGGSFNLSAMNASSYQVAPYNYLGWEVGYGGSTYAILRNYGQNLLAFDSVTYSPMSSQNVGTGFTNSTVSTPAVGEGCGIGITTTYGAAGGASVYVPLSYTSNNPLSGTTTFNSTLDALGMRSGTYTWTFTNGATSDTATLIVAAPPVVSGISPNSGAITGNTAVTISGYNLTAASAVTIGGSACTSITVVSATSITCTTPSGTAGTASVLVTTANGTNAANTLFTFIPPPR